MVLTANNYVAERERPAIYFLSESLNIHQMKLATKALQPQPLLQLHHFDKVAPIVSCYSNQSLSVKLPVCEGILQDFSSMLCNVILWKIVGLEKHSFHLLVFSEMCVSNSACMSYQLSA